MSLLTLNWLPVITGNVISQRVSKRIKSVGGAWTTTGFTTANDMATSVITNVATVNENILYEFKLENICTEGGPTGSVQGIREGIAFACLVPSLSSTGTTVSANINLAGTDITKVRYTLKKSSDNTVVGGPTIITRVTNAAPITFTGLLASTAYYITTELYCTVNGVEVISSSAAYRNAVCGGNASGYQITTESAAPAFTVNIINGVPGWTITAVTGITGFALGGNIATGGRQDGYHTLNGATAICIGLTGAHVISTHMTFYVNNIVIQCINEIDFAGTNCYFSHIILPGDVVRVSLETGSC